MLIQPNSSEERGNYVIREQRLWHNEVQNTPSLGCQRCPEKGVCGGLRIEEQLFDCLTYCCGKLDTCDRICRLRPEAFARAIREIGGFDLANVPRAEVLPDPVIASVVPVLYHGAKRLTPFRASSVCLPLYDVIARFDGSERYRSKAELSEKFGIREDATVILTGTDVDAPLERWWSLSQKRLDAIRALRALGISMVTTPNYSMFTDRPRWDDLHSMKRIAIAHEEFGREGIVAALHVNARTDQDWDRWKRYIADRPEISHLACEFGTGAGWATRAAWHADKLLDLAHTVARPLHLVVRGGSRILPALAAAFSECTFLETNVFMKTQHRQRAIVLPNGKIKWHRSPTEESQPIDSLLNDNWKTVEAFYANMLDKTKNAKKAA